MVTSKITTLSDSYVKHFVLTRKTFVEGKDNKFQGYINDDGIVAGAMINSYGIPSILSGHIYRFLCFRLLLGRATGYPSHPDGAPYIKIGFVTPKYSYGILGARRGFTFIRLKRTKI